MKATNLEPTVNDDRLVFAEIAQEIVTLQGMAPTATDPETKLLDDIRRQCEARIVEIDGALGDV
jgi:hypothetical protein